MHRLWPGLLLLALPLLLQLADIAVGLPRRWPGLASYQQRHFKPFKPKRARFATPLHGFSNIFQNNGVDRWSAGSFPSMQKTSWSEYPVSPPRLQPIPLAHNYYHSAYSAPPPALVPAPVPAPAPLTRRHRFVPARNIQHGKVPTHFMTDAELHGLVCVPASSLASALADHRDQVVRNRDGSVTTHRTVLAGTDGTTSHSTRITSADDGTTVVETRTNSSSGEQQHRQSVQNMGTGVVRTSTGSAFSKGRPGLPTHADVITSSSSEGSNSRSRASASGYDITGKPLPARSISQSISRGMNGQTVMQTSNAARTTSQSSGTAPAAGPSGDPSAVRGSSPDSKDSSGPDHGDTAPAERSGVSADDSSRGEGSVSSEEPMDEEGDVPESGSEKNGIPQVEGPQENDSGSTMTTAMEAGDESASSLNDGDPSSPSDQLSQDDEDADDGDDAEYGDTPSSEDTLHDNTAQDAANSGASDKLKGDDDKNGEGED